MNIKVNVKRRFKVNGKEYNSIEEMPLDIREAFKNATGLQAGLGNMPQPALAQTKIIFNGTEYQGIDSMPPDVRQIYERVLESAETGVAPHDFDIEGITGGMLTDSKNYRTSHQGDVRRPAKVESSFSPRAFIVSAVVVALIFLFYYLFKGR